MLPPIIHHTSVYRKNYNNILAGYYEILQNLTLNFLYSLKEIKDEDNVKNLSIILRNY